MKIPTMIYPWPEGDDRRDAFVSAAARAAAALPDGHIESGPVLIFLLATHVAYVADLFDIDVDFIVEHLQEAIANCILAIFEEEQKAEASQ